MDNIAINNENVINANKHFMFVLSLFLSSAITQHSLNQTDIRDEHASTISSSSAICT